MLAVFFLLLNQF